MAGEEDDWDFGTGTIDFSFTSNCAILIHNMTDTFFDFDLPRDQEPVSTLTQPMRNGLNIIKC